MSLMTPIDKKFVEYAQFLKERLDNPGRFSGGEDTAHMSFREGGKQYVVSVTSNSQILTAALWENGKCLKSVVGKDGILFGHHES